MNLKKSLLILLLLFITIGLYSQNLDSLKSNVFPNNGLTPFDITGFTFTNNYIPSNSFWASPFTEDYVYHAQLAYTHSTNLDKSYEIRIGKGGHIYSFLTSSGETVPPQYPSTAPWVDEVWQMVAVDGTLNNPSNNKKYFIHQAGVYLKTTNQTIPFYSPIVAEYYNPNDNSYTIVNWGQQAHTADNLNSGYTSDIMYYTRFTNLGEGIIQVDFLMYNFGDDTMNFINIPWGGVRRSTYDYWFTSNPDQTYQHTEGIYGSGTVYLEPLSNTGGWAAFSSDSTGVAPTLALLMDNDEGTLRMGDAGTIANRDYTVFEGIKFPGTNLSPGKAIRARNFYILNSNIDAIKDTIINQDLENKTFYGSHNLASNQIDSVYYIFEYQGNELIVNTTNSTNGLKLKLIPYQNSQPLFLIKSTNDEYKITSNLYIYSDIPHDGKLDNVQLLGYTNNKTNVKTESAIICSGEDYTFPDGITMTNITATTYHISDIGTGYNGYDSLIYTTIYTTLGDVPIVDFENNGPGGIGNTNGASILSLWLATNHLLGTSLENPSNGTSIDEWKDLSGNNDNYISSGVNRPTFNNIGNFEAINFDNITNSQFLSGTNQNLSYGTVFMVFNATDNGNENPLLSNSDFSLKYEQSTNSGFLGYSEINGNNYTSNIPSTFGTNNIVSFQANCTNDTLEIYNGNNSDNLNIGSFTNGLPFGELGSTTNPFVGNFYEIIAFETNLNSIEKILVDNYLSSKYGSIIISNDLYDEDETTNGNFDYDVAGIGRIDANNLHNNARGTGVIQFSNPTNLDNDEFFLWGDNGQAFSFTDSIDVPNSIIARTEKIWRVSEVNTSLSIIDIGSVDMSIDFSEADANVLNSIYLIIDANNDGNFNNETIIASTEVRKTDYEGQAEVLFNGINLQDGNRFCFGYLAPNAPGGVYQNLALWLAADSEISTDNGQISNWYGKSENERTATGALGPTLHTSSSKLMNYNPVIEFDGSDNFQVSGGLIGSNTYSDLNFFIVHRLNATPHTSTILLEHVSGGSISSHLPWANGRVYWDAGLSSGDGRINTVSGLSSGDAAIWSLLSHNGTTDAQSIRKNGLTLASDASAVSITGSNSTLNIGSTGSGLHSIGDIAEFIAFVGNEEMTNSELLKIESYLALKYGYTLDNSLGGINGDYFNSNETIIWNADDNSAFHNDVIGICRDDASDLLQKQSNTQDDSLSIYIGTLSAYNGQNTTMINNDFSSILIGHNQGELNDPTYGAILEKPVGITSRLEREWKVTNTNFTDDFVIKITCNHCGNYNINDLRLLVDDDSDFMDAQIFENPDIVISNGSIIVSNIDNNEIPINSTKYITIGTVNASQPLLPIELLSFNVKEENKKVYLNWQTLTEINNDFFTIERSQNGINWEAIAKVESKGNSTKIKQYEVIDEQPYLNQSYYRLKQINIDGQFSYSNIQSILIKKSALRIYPNPTNDKLIVEGEATYLTQLSIWNMLGQNVTNSIRTSGNNTRLEIDFSNLPNGMYILKSKNSVTKIIKE